MRSRFRKYCPVEAVAAYLARLRELATVFFDPDEEEAVPSYTADPNDDYLVVMAGSLHAVLVSGDRHLRDLGSIAGESGTQIRILTPADFLKELDSS